jgi:hypothetical protein
MPPDLENPPPPKLNPSFDYFMERIHVVKKNLILFLITFVAGCLATFSLFSYFVVPGKDSTIQSLQTQLANQPSNQNVIYTDDPNKENLKPADLQKPAIAYDEKGEKPIYIWSPKSQSWK